MRPAPAFRLRSVQFRRERERLWRRLDTLVARVEQKGVTSLTAEELAQLPVLYRAALSSLGVARGISLDRNSVEYLEALVTRAYFCVYGAKRRPVETVLRFFRESFPRLVRRFAPHAAIAAALLFLGTAAGFGVVILDPDRFDSIVPEAMAQGRHPGATTQDLHEALFSGKDKKADSLGAFASFLFTHNTRVGMLCLALGVLAGLPVAWLLFVNGLGLGAMSALYHSRGLSADWWGWILPHGFPELAALVLCGAGGLALGQAVVFPGRHERLRNLAAAGREVGALFAGCVALFLAAGLIEGLFRQAVTDTGVRWIAALGSGGTLAAYFATGWRARR